MEQTTISCGEVLDISQVRALQESMKAVLHEKQGIRICAKDLQRVDGAGVQLLVALFKEAKQLHIDIEWGEVSEALTRSSSILGLEKFLKLN